MTYRPFLIVVCGLPGVGKTTVGRHLADELNADLIRTDLVRNDLFPNPDYTTEEERAVYQTMFDRADTALTNRENIVLDGTFHNRRYRTRAQELADTTDADFRMVHVACREEVVQERIANRENDASDATFEIHRQYRNQFDPVTTDHIRVDNDGPLEETHRQVRQVLPAVESAD